MAILPEVEYLRRGRGVFFRAFPAQVDIHRQPVRFSRSRLERDFALIETKKGRTLGG
jgi:hypothetical protein